MRVSGSLRPCYLILNHAVFPGYPQSIAEPLEETLHIARRYLIPRQLSQTGLTVDQVVFPDETVQRIIGRYTREAGVRELERRLGQSARKIAKRFAEGQSQTVTVRPEDLPEMLGPERFLPEKARKQLDPGVARCATYCG